MTKLIRRTHASTGASERKCDNIYTQAVFVCGGEIKRPLCGRDAIETGSFVDVTRVQMATKYGVYRSAFNATTVAPTFRKLNFEIYILVKYNILPVRYPDNTMIVPGRNVHVESRTERVCVYLGGNT